MNIPAAFTIATAEESQHIDAETVNSFGIDGFTLMELAGTQAAKKILNRLQPGSAGIFLCGKGNNGGDALVVARYLAQHGLGVTLVFVGGTDDLSSAAQKNLDLLHSIAKNDAAATISFITAWDGFDSSVRPDFIVDGMLGTGLDSELRNDFVKAVKWANESQCPIFAMDIPTGLHADTGQVMGDAVKADRTFAFGLLKQGFYLGAGKKRTGQINFCELPFPNYLVQQSSTYLIDDSWLPDQSSELAPHKYEAGVIHIIAGSEGLTGAAILAARSAWAAGVGAVILVCPRGILPVFENNLPQIIKKPVGSRDDMHFKEDHLEKVNAIINEKGGPVLLGPGMGRAKTTVKFVSAFLTDTKRDMIIDADGLWALAQQKSWDHSGDGSWILTPHPGELANLLEANNMDDFQRLNKVKKIARNKNVTLLSKGFPIIIGTPVGNTYLSAYDTRRFSRAGFGDVLAGKVAAFKSMGCNAMTSSVRALLDGQDKASNLNKNRTMEPLDLI
jgi:NAD(P)H-hydrate epimerase